jgi:magnesium chelatase family protein
MSASVQSIISPGFGGMVVDIECHLPNIIIVGFANKSVDEAKERLCGAFANSNIAMPRKRATINLAPADMPKPDNGFALAIAVAILATSHQIPANFGKHQALVGELGLDGSTGTCRCLPHRIIHYQQKTIGPHP